MLKVVCFGWIIQYNLRIRQSIWFRFFNINNGFEFNKQLRLCVWMVADSKYSICQIAGDLNLQFTQLWKMVLFIGEAISINGIVPTAMVSKFKGNKWSTFIKYVCFGTWNYWLCSWGLQLSGVDWRLEMSENVSGKHDLSQQNRIY